MYLTRQIFGPDQGITSEKQTVLKAERSIKQSKQKLKYKTSKNAPES